MNPNYNPNFNGQNNYYMQPAPQPVSPDAYVGDPRFKPLSPWVYLGYFLLFTVVPFGWIAAIVFSFNDDNINRRNFARAYWCAVLVSVILTVIGVIIVVILGISFGSILGNLSDLSYYY